MGKETRIGLAVIVVLLGVFGTVLFKRLQGASLAAQQAKAKAASAPTNPPPAEPRKFASGPLKPSLVSEAKTPATTTAEDTPSAGSRWTSPAANTSTASSSTNSSPASSTYGSDRYAASAYGASGQSTDNRYGADRTDRYASSAAPIQPTSASYDATASDASQATQATLGAAQATAEDATSVAADPFRRGTEGSAPAYAPYDANQPSVASDQITQGTPSVSQEYVPPGQRGNPLRYGGEDPASMASDGRSTASSSLESPASSASRGPAGYDISDTPSRYTSPAGTAATSTSLPGSSPAVNDSTTQDGFRPSYSASDSRYGSQSVISATQGSTSATNSAFGPASRSNTPQPPDDAFKRGNDTYVVAPNDNYWSISEKVYGTGGYFKALHEHNRQRHPRADRLQTGDVISTPSAEALTQTYPQLCPKPERVQQQQRAALISSQRRHHTGKSYIVEEGDTLFDIARFELGRAARWAEIYELNKDLLGADFNHLKPGTELIMPAEGQPDTLTRRPTNNPAR